MNDYFYKKYISKNKDVLAAAKEVENATRPLKMEIEKVISVITCSPIITIYICLNIFICFNMAFIFRNTLLNIKKFG